MSTRARPAAVATAPGVALSYDRQVSFFFTTGALYTQVDAGLFGVYATSELWRRVIGVARLNPVDSMTACNDEPLGRVQQ
jgi:hypothetical protein